MLKDNHWRLPNKQEDNQLIDQISYSALNLEMFFNMISVYAVMILSFACLFIEMLYYKYKKFKKSCFIKELCRTRFKSITQKASNKILLNALD